MSRTALIAHALAFACVAGCGSPSALGTSDAGQDDASVPLDATSCGLGGKPRGLSQREVTIDGLRRTYLVYLPAGVEPATPIPLVLVFHGYTMSGQLMHDITEYTTLADTEHIALAFPDGQGGPSSSGAPWNVGSGVCPSFFGAPPTATGNDFALLDSIKADIADDQCLDRDHLFATGFSMGGYFAHHLGCMRPDVRAVAPHSGGTGDLDQCITGPTPIIMFHGLSDSLVPAGCDDPEAPPVAGVTPAATAWAQKNGCATTTTSRVVEGGTCVRYDGCPANGQVELCTFPGMGHCWAGGAPGSGIYACPSAASATTLQWEFFKQNAW